MHVYTPDCLWQLGAGKFACRNRAQNGQFPREAPSARLMSWQARAIVSTCVSSTRSPAERGRNCECAGLGTMMGKRSSAAAAPRYL